jgi:hypothetical protein
MRIVDYLSKSSFLDKEKEEIINLMNIKGLLRNTIVSTARQTIIGDQENTHDHRSESMKLLDKITSPSDDELKKKHEQQSIEVALNSPMFNDRDGNGITTAYIGSGIHMDTATLHLNLEPASFQNSILNTSDQKWSTDLDDFFPQPLQPFSF